jgi:hypothetical protein
MAIWGWFDVRVRGSVDPHTAIHKTDFTVYTEAGAAFFDGRDPYQVTNPRGWGYLYPPLFAILVSPLHAFEPTTQVLVWFALSVLMCWGCYRECLRIARVVLPDVNGHGVFGPIPTWVGSAAVAAALLPALNCLQRGQVAVAKLYLLLLGFRLLVESRSAARSFLAGNVLALPIVLKLTPLLPVAIVLFEELVAACHNRSGRAPFSRAAACSAGTLSGLVLCVFLIPACLVGWNANLRHLNSWCNWVLGSPDVQVGEEFAGDNTSVRNQSFSNAAHRLGNWVSYGIADDPYFEGPEQLRRGGRGLAMDAPPVGIALTAIRFFEGCLLVWLAYRMGRRQDSLAHAVGFSLACVATLVISPIARGHYYVLFLPAVLFLTVWLLRQQRPKAAVAFAVVPAVLVIAHYAAMDFTGHVGVLGLGTTVWFTCAAITVLALDRRTIVATHQRDALPEEQAAIDQPLAA